MIQVGIWYVPIVKKGFVLYVLTASIAIRVNTHMLSPKLAFTSPRQEWYNPYLAPKTVVFNPIPLSRKVYSNAGIVDKAALQVSTPLASWNLSMQ